MVHIDTEVTTTSDDELVSDGPRRARPGASWTALVVIVVVSAFLLGGARLIFGSGGGHDHGDHDHADGGYALGEDIELDHAVIRVDGVRPEVMAAMSMPASMMPDHLPDGYRRFAVDMFVTASDAVGFDPVPEMFTVTGADLEPTPPHRALVDPDRIGEGFSAYVSMLFQTPIDVEPLVLQIGGQEIEVLLAGDLGDGHDHGETPNDIVISGFFEAEIEDYEFSPGNLIVEVGTEVVFHNHDVVRHNATARDGSWHTEDVPSDGRTQVVVFDRPGTYEYTCTLHPSMVGTITVVDSGSTG